jgi:hypothetical protein
MTKEGTDDREKTEPCGAPTWACDQPAVPGSPCPDHGGPPLTPSPREATSANSAGPSLPQPPGGAPIIHGPSKPDITEGVQVLVDGLTSLVWWLSSSDYGASADMLETAIDLLEQERDAERRRASSEARARCRWPAAREEKA